MVINDRMFFCPLFSHQEVITIEMLYFTQLNNGMILNINGILLQL